MENSIEKVKVQIFENGPLAISGPFKMAGQYGEKDVVNTTLYLCRCGESKNKPYCDGTHKTNGFKG